MVTMVITLFLFVLFAFLLRLMTRHPDTRLTTPELVAAFGFKVLMACAYGYIFLHYYGGDDTWELHKVSLHEWRLLFDDPGQFFWDLTPAHAWHVAQGNTGFALRHYLDKLELHLPAKALGIFNVISRGNYYANAVFFSFLTFWGHYWLFKLVTGAFPHKRRLWFLLIFFYPPVIFWLSGVRSDGLLFLFLALLLLHAWRWIQENKRSSLLYLILGMVGVIIFRDVVILLLAPALVAWFIAVRYDRRPLPVFLMVYGVSVVVFFGSILLPGAFNFPSLIVARQQEFLALQGNTRLPLDTLEPTAGSFFRILPQAISNTFLRPYLWEARGLLQVMTALDILLFWLLVILAVVWRKKDNSSGITPLFWFLLFFGVSLYIFIGYVIPFPGAIVRYKVIPELFLLIVVGRQLRV